jgi:DUF4097 and DUF4098 domain-containing protein YvlB
MKVRLFTSIFCVAIAVSLAGYAAQAQDFHKTYPASSGLAVRIMNVSGNVQVDGYAGEVIVVDTVKTGSDSGQVRVEDLSIPGRVELKVVYPEHGSSNASIHFNVKVPQGIDLNFERLDSVSGSVEIRGVRGRIRAASVSGHVTVKNVAGIVSAQSVSGNVEVEILKLEGSGEMKFSSVSGSVSVKAPSTLDADVEMSSVSGTLKCDFPVEIQERRYGPGRSAKGRLGSGMNHLRITSVSGRVGLIKM